MRIKSLHLKNIRSYIDEVINFPLGSILLAGDVGSGKSTILMAILFALFSPISSELSNNALLRHGAQSGYIELVIEVSGKEIRIRRNLVKTSKAVKQDVGAITIEGAEDNPAPTVIKAKMLEILGYPIELLNKHYIDIFKFTVYTPQEQIKQIIMADADSRKQTLNAVFDIDRYKLVGDGASQTTTEINRMVKQLSLISKGLATDKEDLNKAREKLKESQEKYSETIKKYKKVETEKSNVEKDLEKIQKELEELAKLEAAHKAALEQKDQIQLEIEDSRKNIDKKKAELQLTELELGEKERQLTPVSGSEADLKQRKKIVERKIREFNAEITRLEQKISELEKILSEGVCATCEQDVQDTAKFKGKIEEKKAKNKDLSRQRDELDQENQQIQETLDKIAANKVLEAEVRLLKDKITLIKGEISDLSDNLSKLQLRLETLIQKITDLERKIAGRQSLKDQKVILQGKQKFLEKQLRDLEGIKSELEERIRNLKESIKNLEAEIQMKEEAQKHKTHLQEVSQWLKDFLPSLLQEMESQATVSIWYDFNDLFKEWFGVLIQDDSIEVKLDEAFTPEIIQNGYETDFSANLSGGEGTSVALAYRLALNQVINNQKEDIKTKDLIILDEPTYGFSRDQLKRVRDVFKKLNAPQLIVVSHEPQVETFVDEVIRITKKNNISHTNQDEK